MDSHISLPEGKFSSDPNIRLRELFAPDSVPEIDLSGGSGLSFDFAPELLVHQVELQIAFMPGGPPRPVQADRDVLEILSVESAPLRPPEGPGLPRSLSVRALSGDTVVQEFTVTGRAHRVVSAVLTSDSITKVEIDAGPAVLVELCYEPLPAQGRWEPLDGFECPLALPVYHPDYPASGARPSDLDAAQSMALGRIRYGDPRKWSGETFTELHEQLLALVGLGPPGTRMAGLETNDVPSISGRPETDPTLRTFSPLDWLHFSSLDPAMAQMLGVYWVDPTAEKERSYDYLILADVSGEFNGSSTAALAFANQLNPDYSQVNGWLCPNRRLQQDPRLRRIEHLLNPNGLRLP